MDSYARTCRHVEMPEFLGKKSFDAAGTMIAAPVDDSRGRPNKVRGVLDYFHDHVIS